jgi:hypothetical protein
LKEEGIGLGRIDAVHQRGLAIALDQVGVLARAIWERNQGIEQTPVPVDGAHPINAISDLACFHCWISLVFVILVMILQAGSSAVESGLTARARPETPI